MDSGLDLANLLGSLSELPGLVKLTSPEKYWQWGTTPLPKGEYHQAVIYVYGDYSPAVLAAIPKTFEAQARTAGFRLLKVHEITVPPETPGFTGHLFAGYAASDIWEQTVGELSNALMGAPVIIDSEPAGAVETAALDAMWISIQVQVPEKVETKVDFNIGLAAGLVAILGVGLLLWATTRAKK